MAGVAIGTVTSQMISCILVIRCLCRSEGSYRMSFSRLGIKAVSYTHLDVYKRQGNESEGQEAAEKKGEEG